MKRLTSALLVLALIISLFPALFAAAESGPIVTPVVVSGNDSPAAVTPNGYVYYKLDTGTVGTYEFKFNENGEISSTGKILVTVTISNSGLGYTWVSWSSNINLYSVIVKGGPQYNLYQYNDQYNSDSNLVTPKKGSKHSDVSHVSFVFNPDNYEEPEDPGIPPSNISLDGIKYAYIFGHEPMFISRGEGLGYDVILNMDMDGPVTIEQVSAMIMRLLDQEYDNMNTIYPVTDKISRYKGAWFERGLAYMASVGAFDNVSVAKIGKATRADVARLLTYGLKLTARADVPYTDAVGHPEYDSIRAMYAFGFMLGTSPTTFTPDRVMTRGEFCALMNRITGKDHLGLEALDKNGVPFTITKDTYFFTDMNDPTHWAYNDCLKATSDYNENGYIDLERRQQNIRNILDQYQDQTQY